MDPDDGDILEESISVIPPHPKDSEMEHVNFVYPHRVVWLS